MARRKVYDGNNVKPLTLCVTRQGGKCHIAYMAVATAFNIAELVKLCVPAEYLAIYYAIGLKKALFFANKFKSSGRSPENIRRVAHIIYRRSIAFYVLLRVPLYKIAEAHSLTMDDLIQFMHDEQDYFRSARRVWQSPGNFVAKRVKEIYGVDYALFTHSKEYLHFVKHYYKVIYERDSVDYEHDFRRAIR